MKLSEAPWTSRHPPTRTIGHMAGAVESARAAAEHTAKAKKEGLGSPGLDALVLATARETRAKVLTGDRHFKGFLKPSGSLNDGTVAGSSHPAGTC